VFLKHNLKTYNYETRLKKASTNRINNMRVASDN